jgi:hypothetical protein
VQQVPLHHQQQKRLHLPQTGGAFFPFSLLVCFTITLSLLMSQISDIKAQHQSHIFATCDLKGKAEVIGLPDLMTLFIDLGCLYCKQTERAFNVFKNTLN